VTVGLKRFIVKESRVLEELKAIGARSYVGYSVERREVCCAKDVSLKELQRLGGLSRAALQAMRMGRGRSAKLTVIFHPT